MERTQVGRTSPSPVDQPAVNVNPIAINPMHVSSWTENPHLAALKEVLAAHANQQVEEGAGAANEAVLREALFQIHRLVATTVENFGSNPLLSASALLLLKRQAIDPTPFCVSANYSGWDDKQRATGIKDFVERKIISCREILGEADFALLQKAVDYEFGGRKSLTEYYELWGEFDQAARLIEIEEEAYEERREWEARRDLWMPRKILGIVGKLSLFVALVSLFLLVLRRIFEELGVESRLSAPTFYQGLVEAAGVGLACFLFFGLVSIAASIRGKKIYGAAPPKSGWPTAEMVSKLRAGAVIKRFPRYAQLHGVLENAKAAMLVYDRKHGVASRAEIEEEMKATESERDSLFQRYNITVLPTWD